MVKSQNQYPALTVNDLWKACIVQRKKGNGKKKILISCDDEGNGYHGLFYEFLDDSDELKCLFDCGLVHDKEAITSEDIVVLG